GTGRGPLRDQPRPRVAGQTFRSVGVSGAPLQRVERREPATMHALAGLWLLVALALWGCHTPSEPCSCTDADGVENGHGVTLCDGGDCTACQCLTFAPPTVDPVPATTRFVDADASRGDGSEASPWPVPDWDVLDDDVALGPLLVAVDARGARP